MIIIVRDDNNGKWSTMCGWLNEHMPNTSEVSHTYVPYSDDIELKFKHEADAIMFILKFGL